MSKITVSLVDQGVAVPDTGQFTSTTGANGAVIGIGALLLLFAVIGISIKLVNKNKAHRNFSKNTKFHISKTPIIGLSVLIVALAGAGFAMFHGESRTGSVSAASDSGDTLTIAVDDAELDIAPSADGAFGAVMQAVKVTAPTEAGYTLGVYADSADLVNEEDKKSVIAGLEESAVNVALTANAWGFSLEKTEDAATAVWSAMPSAGTGLAILKNTQTATAKDDTTNVYYGVNANTDLPLGKYSTVINYVAVANNPVIYMQDVATVKAELTEVGDTTEAVDMRDNKTYWVTKMADGNIWMTQNLDLDIDSTKTYTSEDTDVSTSWKPSSSTHPQDEPTWEKSTTAPESYDPGDVYYYNSATTGDDIAYSSLEDCIADNHTSDECAHYHVGNYYNWSAAVADNDTSDMTVQYSNAPDSICPAGWNLPMGPNEAGTATAGYNSLLNAEGVAASPTEGGYTDGGFDIIRANPVYLVRSGYMRNSLTQGGQVGQYWTSTVGVAEMAERKSYKMIFNSTVLQTTAGVNTTVSDGVSVRCMLK